MKFRGNRRQFKDLVAFALAVRVTARFDFERNAWRKLHALHRKYGSATVETVCEALRAASEMQRGLLLVAPWRCHGHSHAFALAFRSAAAPARKVLQ